MKNLKSTIAIIPARKGSSFKSKNTYLLLDKCLVEYTLDAVKYSAIEGLITSDSEAVLNYASWYGFKRDKRPSNLADDKATLDQVIYYIANKYEYENYVLLPPTSPLRDSEDIINAIYLFLESNSDSLISCTEERRSIWKKQDKFFNPLIDVRKNRQEQDPCYIANGAIFIAKREIILKYRKKVGGRVVVYPMPIEKSIDIHSLDDIEMAEYLYKSNDLKKWSKL